MMIYVYVVIVLFDIVYLEWNLCGECVVVLLYGWLDSLVGWEVVVVVFVVCGYCVFVFVLCGFVLMCFCDVFVLCSG